MNLDEAIKRLRDLNESVPMPMRLPTAAEVDRAETELGVPFHSDYRRFLLDASDVVFGSLEPATLTDAESHTYLPTVCESAWEEMELPRTLLPFCEDNCDYYCLTAGGEVRFWSNDGAAREKWRDLAAWIEEVWIGETEE